MADYKQLMEGFGERAKPLDTQGDYKALMEGFKPTTPTPPTVSGEVVEDLTKKPVGRPREAGETDAPQAMYRTATPSIAPEVIPPTPTQTITDTGSVIPGLSETQRTGLESEAQLAEQGVQLSPYLTGGSYGTGVEQIQQEAQLAGEQMPLEDRESYKEWYKEEGLPAAGMVLGTVAAPMTGGTSFWAALGASAAVTGAGAFAGEAAEQTFKKEGIMAPAIGEEPPRNGWDILGRATVKAGEEAAYDAIGGLFLRGITRTLENQIRAASNPRVDAAGKVLDQGRQDLVDTVRRWADLNGKEEGDAILASQVADVVHYRAMEDVAKSSYIGSKPVQAVLTQQEEVIKGEAKELVAGLTTEAKTAVAADEALGRYYKSNMDNTSDFTVAGLVRKAFTDAQNQQKSIARSIYNTMDALANKTDVKQVIDEVPSGFFRPDGSEIMSQVPRTKEINKFPVNTSEIRDWAAEKVDDTLLKADPVLGELMDLPREATMKQVGEALSELKGRSRTLGDSIKMGSAAENAPKRKLLLDEAITKLEKEYDVTIDSATAAGVVGPDGKTLRELKNEADGIWSQQVKDFQNNAIVNILKNTDLVNGAPDELVTQFLKSPADAEKVLNALDIGKRTLEGDSLASVVRAEEMIKGSLVERILLPVDPVNKSYGLPNTTMFSKNSTQLKMLLGDETYESVRRLIGATEQHTRTVRSSTLAFAQKARESGMTVQALDAAMRSDASVSGKVSSTLLIALGAGKILTNPKNLKFAEKLDDLTVSPAYKRRALRFLVEETMHYMGEQEDALSPAKRDQLNAIMKARKEEEAEFNL